VFTSARTSLREEIDKIRASGLYKVERVLDSAQDARIEVAGREVINFCANNYLGLADDPAVIAAAQAALSEWGYGLASVRFICGTQSIHRELEVRLAAFLGTDDAILYSSCFDANGGLFETLLGDDDVVISDELNHASIIDGIRLSRATRRRYRNRDMADLREQLEASRGARRRLIATDGVFSMDGSIAPLDEICDLADEFDAMVMVDDSHAVGFVGAHGRGTPELFDVTDRVDIVTGTLGKALGGASGGYTAARAEIVELLRQRSRPYLFSNSLAPAIAGASLAVLDLLATSDDRRHHLAQNAALFRRLMGEAGFDLLPGEHAIVPVMLGDPVRATRMADALLERGIYVIAFSYPVVPLGRERIRVQLSAAHSTNDIERAVAAFVSVRDQLDQHS